MNQPLDNKKILIGISGGIAAYKTIELIRLLKTANAQVKVVLTQSASHFVTPMTLQAISGNAVAQELFNEQAELAMSHIELAKWADLIIIAPTTADLIARLTVGMANDLLSTLCLATSSPILLAPAMNQQMYAKSIVQNNLLLLRQRDFNIIGPNSGEQACGDIGAGRMSEPAEIVDYVMLYFSSLEPALFEGLKVTITAGPTREKIDPVRFISNYSSGKMGFALAEAFAHQGAEVTLITGPVQLATPNNVNRINVISAQDMWQASLDIAAQQDIFIGCAAVADYRVAQIAVHKIKKTDDNNELHLSLVKNLDIIADVAKLTENRPFVVGFAAETQDIKHYAQSKLVRKNLDLICANDVSSATQGFNSDHNAITVFCPKGSFSLELETKKNLAKKLAHIIVKHFKKQEGKNEKN